MSEALKAFCSECGTPGAGARFCVQCGTSLVLAAPPAPDAVGVDLTKRSPGEPAPFVEPSLLPVDESVDPYESLYVPHGAGTTPGAAGFVPGFAPPAPEPPVPATPFAAAPVKATSEGRGRGALVAAVVLTLVLGAAGAGGAWWWSTRDDSSTVASTSRDRDADRDRDREREKTADRDASDDVDEFDAIDDPGADPLALGTPIANQSCSGQYVVMLASSGDPSAYASTLRPALAADPQAKYLVTSQSCSSFNQQIDGNDIYAAYLGPFPDAESACAARTRLGWAGSYLRLLETDAAGRDSCGCTYEDSALPRLQKGDGGGQDVPTSLVVSDLQVLLSQEGYNPDRIVDGTFGKETARGVRKFQRANGLEVDGVVGPDTWWSLRDDCWG